ncbi:MAG TPA: hypothetical protein VGR01_19745 [Burkholderiales bacterium]|jgi:hypothetical protein|nr:hypothetical protein [Burkholderiales bacterium]
MSSDKFKQFDLAIQNHDLAAAKRLAVKLCEDINPGKPIDIWRIDFMVRCYAGEMYGWEIEGRR